jgi:hypothetical protein
VCIGGPIPVGRKGGLMDGFLLILRVEAVGDSRCGQKEKYVISVHARPAGQGFGKIYRGRQGGKRRRSIGRQQSTKAVCYNPEHEERISK